MENVNIKQEICDDDDGFQCPPEVDVVIKEENELIIEDDSNEQLCSTSTQIECRTEENTIKEEPTGFIIDEFGEFGDPDEDSQPGYADCDFGFLEECYTDDDYTYDDDGNVDNNSTCRRQRGKVKFAFVDEPTSTFYTHYKKIVKLQSNNYIRVLCPFCDRNMKSFSMWARHLNERHIEFAENVKNNYEYQSYRKAQCKTCNEISNFNFSHFLHYLTNHSPDTHKLFLCNVCNHKDVCMESILNHINDKHNKLNDLYRMCPLCNVMFPDGKLMRQHFMDMHNMEFKKKYKYYNCHLCNHPRFYKEFQYYDHLMNLHGLYGHDWEQLNFKKIGYGKSAQFQCTKCMNNCGETGPHKLLEHYLTHEDHTSWCCEYCDTTFHFKEFLHLCKQMYKFLNKSHNSSLCSPTTSHNAGAENEDKQLEDWQKFESYIIHTCPFCNVECNDFPHWQQHMRQQHFINTLKSLRMSVANDPEKLRCLDCDTLVPKCSWDLHTHRFQHLPYMPYKCRHCLLPLENENIAFEHIISQCKDDNEDLLSLEHVPRPKILDDENNWIEILCTLCKNDQFSSVADIENHFRIQHKSFELNYRKSSNNLDMVCKRCRTTIRSVSSDICLSHYIKHLKDGPYKCLYCRRSYKEFDICRRHVRRFHMIGARQRKTATITKKPVLSKYSPANRKKPEPKPAMSELGLGTSASKANILNEFQEFIRYACAECNDSFDMQNLWSDHIKAHHNFFNDNELSEINDADGKRRCKHCHLVLGTSISHRQKHKLTHMPYKSFVCSLCDTRCTTLGLLYGHLRRIHFSKGTYECPICLVNLSTSYERSEHVNRTHPRSEWPHNMCLICYRKYTSLRSHMLSHDINRPKYVCQVCGVSIIYLKDFQVHMKRKHNATVDCNVQPIQSTTVIDECGESSEVLVNKMEDELEGNPTKKLKQ